MATVRGWMKARAVVLARLLASWWLRLSCTIERSIAQALTGNDAGAHPRDWQHLCAGTRGLCRRSRDIGLAQRAGFVSRLRARFTPSLLIDGTTKPARSAERCGGSAAGGGYSAVVVSPLDLAVSHGSTDAAGLRHLPRAPPAAATPRGRVFTVGRRVGIVSGAVSPPGALDALSAVPALRAQNDVVIVACRATKQVAAQLGTRSRAGSAADVVGIGPRATLVRLGRCA